MHEEEQIGSLEGIMSDQAKPERVCTPDPDCGYCRGTGEMDSGGTTPWGAGINVRCDCTYPRPAEPPAATRSQVEEMAFALARRAAPDSLPATTMNLPSRDPQVTEGVKRVVAEFGGVLDKLAEPPAQSREAINVCPIHGETGREPCAICYPAPLACPKCGGVAEICAYRAKSCQHGPIVVTSGTEDEVDAAVRAERERIAEAMEAKWAEINKAAQEYSLRHRDEKAFALNQQRMGACDLRASIAAAIREGK